jgi:hypothetical protein
MAARDVHLQVHVEKDEYGLPVVSWVEPRREHRTTLLVFSWEAFPYYNARCWIHVDAQSGEAMFVHHHEGDFKGKNSPPMIGSHLSDLTGFSLHSLEELYGNGAMPLPKSHPEVDTYRDDLVVGANFARAWIPGGPTLMPLTITTAPRSDVMRLHSALTEAFVINAEAVRRALAARGERQRDARIEERWKAFLKAPVLSGGRKFVNLWERSQSKESEPLINPADGESLFGLFKDSQEGAVRFVLYRHVFERRRQGVAERWMVSNAFWIHDSSHYRHPDLIEVLYTTLEGRTRAYKPRKLFKAARVFGGNELRLPPAYLAAPDVRIDASTLILCLEFADGELLPLTHAPASERASVERLRGQMEYVFAGAGNGGSNVVL